MFRNKNLNITIFFSIAWHLFWLSAIYIVVTPTVKLQNKYMDVNFLGPILGKTAFEIMAEESTPFTETVYHTEALFKNESYLDVEGPKKIDRKDAFEKKEILKFRQKEIFAKRDNAAPAVIDGKSIFYHIEEKAINKFIEGPARERAILYKPQLPLLSKSLYRDQANFMVRLKFMLSKEGNVELIEPVSSAGYPSIDMECIKYIKQWKFAPKEAKEKEWGIITLDVRAE